MLGEHERLVEHGIHMRCDVESAAVQLVRVVTNPDVMSHPNRGIVDQPPTGAANREAERELPVQLCALAASPAPCVGRATTMRARPRARVHG